MDKANGLLRLFAWQPPRAAASLKFPYRFTSAENRRRRSPGMAGEYGPRDRLPGHRRGIR
jgi:hypothetical protein